MQPSLSAIGQHEQGFTQTVVNDIAMRVDYESFPQR
jgi:hypothetical protein